jgi:hypothetical protein
LSWRFRQWYQNPQLLAAIAAPPLREIAQQLEHLVDHANDIRGLQNPGQNFVTIYSCHDVTLLALLYALGSDFLAEETSSVWKEFWPEYASTLAIELVRLDDEEKIAANGKEKEPQHIMRVLMNGRVVTSTDFLFQKFEREKGDYASNPPNSDEFLTIHSNPLGQGPYGLLTTRDFWNIVTQLESQGEYDFALWPKMKDDLAMGDPLNGEPATGKDSKPNQQTSSLDSSLN